MFESFKMVVFSSCMMLSFPQWRFPRVFQISGWVWVCAPGSHKQMVISLITMPHVIDYLILCHISLYHMSLSHIYHSYILISKCYDYIIYITDTHVLQAFPGCTSGYQPLNCFFPVNHRSQIPSVHIANLRHPKIWLNGSACAMVRYDAPPSTLLKHTKLTKPECRWPSTSSNDPIWHDSHVEIRNPPSLMDVHSL